MCPAFKVGNTAHAQTLYLFAKYTRLEVASGGDCLRDARIPVVEWVNLSWNVVPPEFLSNSWLSHFAALCSQHKSVVALLTTLEISQVRYT